MSEKTKAQIDAENKVKEAAEKRAKDKEIQKKIDEGVAKALADREGNEGENSEKENAELEKKQKEAKLCEDYQKFAELKFLMWDGKEFLRKALSEDALKKYDSLEKKFKEVKGNKPLRNATVFIGIGTENTRLVKGYAVPDSVYKMFEDGGKLVPYFKAK